MTWPEQYRKQADRARQAAKQYRERGQQEEAGQMEDVADAYDQLATPVSGEVLSLGDQYHNIGDGEGDFNPCAKPEGIGSSRFSIKDALSRWLRDW